MYSIKLVAISIHILLASGFLFADSSSNTSKKHYPMPKDRTHIVFLISEDVNNYEAHRTIPIYARTLEEKHNFKTTVLLGEGPRNAFKFPGLKKLKSADLLVVFCRRVALSEKQMGAIQEYLAQGKPVLGIRTANHAFSVMEEITEGYEDWSDFVPQILGCQNRGYGPAEIGTTVSKIQHATHPILKGLPESWNSDGNIYKVKPLLDHNATILLEGVAGENTEPICWIRNTEQGSKVFYTSLGYPKDFENPVFQKLISNAAQWLLSSEN